jgi:hypothetical protein
MSDPSYSCPEVLWPERVPAVFAGGSLDGRELQVPARVLPPLILGVRVDQAGQVVEMRPGSQLPQGYTAEGWLEYWRDLRYRVRDKPHTFMHRPR